MKKAFALILMIVSICLCATLVACGEKEHTHTFGEWVVTETPTCEKAGKQVRKCSECDKEEELPIDKLPHDPVETARTESTCKTAGHAAGTKCSMCGATLSGMEPLPLAEHTYSEWKVVKAATCSEEGQSEGECEVCGHVENKPIEKLNHTPMNVERKEPTCKEKGHEAGVKCSVCGETIEGLAVIAKADHRYSEWAPYENASCTATGRDRRYCLDCNEEEFKTIEKLDHQYGEWRTTTNATCSTKGMQKRNCIRCDHEDTAEIPTTPHTLVTIPRQEPTCKEQGAESGQRCSVCGEDVSGFEPIPKKEHSLGEWTTLSDATCTEPGTKKRSCENCDYYTTAEIPVKPHEKETLARVEPTCTEPGLTEGERCSICETILVEQSRIDPIGHSFGSYIHDDGVTDKHMHKAECEICHAVYVSGECQFDTTETPATCTQPVHHVHKCGTCGYSYEHDEGSALGHSWSDWRYDGEENGKHWHKKVCLRAEGDENHEVMRAECKDVKNVVEASCESIGYTQHECDECSHTYTDSRVEAYGHDMSGYRQFYYYEWYVHVKQCVRCGKEYGGYVMCTLDSRTVAPTCNESGKLILTCKVCGNTATEKAGDALGHSYGGYEPTDGEHHKRVCQRKECGFVLVEPCNFVDADKAPTCNSAGVNEDICKDCFNVKNQGEIPALQHKYGAWQSTERGEHFHTCDLCGHLETNECAYEVTITPATCDTCATEKYTCRICNDTYTDIISEAYGHTYEKWDTTADAHSATCVKCGHEENSSHDFSDSNLCAICRYDGLKYEFGNEQKTFVKVSIDKAVKISKHIKIASTWQSTPVTEIARSGFSGYLDMESLEMPSSIVVIGELAFYGALNLRTVTMDDVASSKLQTIEDNAFRFCRELQSAQLPSGLKVIGKYAFADCTALREITIPDTVEEVGTAAFSNTAYLDDETHWNGDAIYINGFLIRVKSGFTGEYNILNGTKVVCAEAFADCVGLSKVYVPASVTTFDIDAFAGCINLHEMDYGGTFNEFLKIKFENDKASPLYYARTVDIEGATGNIVIPDDTKRIPAGLFKNSDIVSIVLPESVTTIGANAFNGCSKLKTVTVKGKLTEVGENAFTGSLYYDTPDNWTDEGLLYVGGALIAADSSKAKNVVTDIKIADGTTAIAAGAFDNYSGVVKLTIPFTVMWIGKGAFENIRNTIKEAVFTPAGSKGGYYFAYTANGMGRVLSDERLCGNVYSVANDIKLYNGVWKRTPPSV